MSTVSSKSLSGLPPGPTLVPVTPLVGAQEIAKMLGGISRQRVQQLVSDPRYDFPAPYVELAMGKVWNTEDVVRWAEARGREIVRDES